MAARPDQSRQGDSTTTTAAWRSCCCRRTDPRWLPTRHAQQYRRDNATARDGEDAIHVALLIDNDARCIPPLPADDVTTIAHDIAKKPTPTDLFHLTDAGNAEFFAKVCRDVCFDHQRKQWVVFGPHHWRIDPNGEVGRLALSAIRRRQAVAVQMPAESESEQKIRGARVKWCIASENRNRLQAMLALAENVAGLADSGNAWDHDPYLLGVPNGVINLHTGERRDGQRADRISLVTAVPYIPKSTCPRWSASSSKSHGNPDLAGFLQRSFGYSLTGDVEEQKIWIAYGTGANGKSTLLETWAKHVIPEHSWTMPFPAEGWSEAMTEYQKAMLAARRFVMAKENQQTKRLNSEVVKGLTGGDTINARHPYGRPFQFRPNAKIWLAVNHKPVIRDDSHGMWRRVFLVPFTRTFKVDTTLPATLAAEAPGILAWAVRGCLDWQQSGLQPPKSVLAATAEYQQHSDPMSEFLDEKCVIDPSVQIGGLELFTTYRRWCDLRQMPVVDRLSQRAFGERMKARFESDDKRTISYLGVALVGAGCPQEVDLGAAGRMER